VKQQDKTKSKSFTLPVLHVKEATEKFYILHVAIDIWWNVAEKNGRGPHMPE